MTEDEIKEQEIQKKLDAAIAEYVSDMAKLNDEPVSVLTGYILSTSSVSGEEGVTHYLGVSLDGQPYHVSLGLAYEYLNRITS